ncbi:DUF397 domain-containing protein [Streptomyces sp. NPDC002669]|uniref:DUF397 domain-containing protein n=1 Tax=Streptomyces sp. NPDC002669 TaxID=3364658 RepID=UPI0036B7AE78
MNTALEWFKSSYSGSEGGQCLEVGYDWQKSSHSGDFEDACVEVAAHTAAVHIRDSKNPDGPTLTIAPTTWTAFAGFAADRRTV